MSLKRIHFFVLFTWTVMYAVFPIITTAQEKEKSGTTVDAWRQALPPAAEAQKAGEEMPDAIPASLSNAEATKTLLALERRWMDSLKVGDADSLGQIISGDFAFVSPRMSNVKDRIQYLEYALRDLKLTSYEFDKTTVRLFGRTAIVSAMLKQNAAMKGEDWTGNYVVTDVWINRNGTWQAVSRHESRVK